MYLRMVFDQLIRYFDAEKNYYNEPVLREELSIQYKGRYDSMLTDISKASNEERLDAIEKNIRKPDERNEFNKLKEIIEKAIEEYNKNSQVTEPRE